MHESSIARAILDKSNDVKNKENMKNIKSVKILVGKLHSIVTDVLVNLYDIMKSFYNGFENSVLIIEERNVKIRCKGCSAISTLDSPFFLCPLCGSNDTELIEGNEMLILSIEGEIE